MLFFLLTNRSSDYFANDPRRAVSSIGMSNSSSVGYSLWNREINRNLNNVVSPIFPHQQAYRFDDFVESPTPRPAPQIPPDLCGVQEIPRSWHNLAFLNYTWQLADDSWRDEPAIGFPFYFFGQSYNSLR